MFFLQGLARTRQVVDDVFQRRLRHHLEAFQRVAGSILAVQQQAAGGPEVRHACPDHPPLLDCRRQLQSGGGDDPQRAFRADQQLLEVESAIVLFERDQRIERAAIGKHGLQPHHLRPHGTVPQHLGSPGIGGNKAPDRG